MVFRTHNMRYSFGKTQRVTRSGDFTKIIRLGTCVADGTLVLFALPTTPEDNTIRIGITIPKKTGERRPAEPLEASYSRIIPGTASNPSLWLRIYRSAKTGCLTELDSNRKIDPTLGSQSRQACASDRFKIGDQAAILFAPTAKYSATTSTTRHCSDSVKPGKIGRFKTS